MIKFKNLLIGTLIIGGIISFFGTNVKAEEDYNKINSRIDYIPNEETTFNISTNSNFNMNKVMKNNFVQGGTLWKEVDKIERYGKTYNSTVFDFVSGYDNNKKYGNKGKYVESKEKYGIYRDYKTNEQQRKLLVDELVNMLSTDRLYGQNGRYSATSWALSKYDDKSYIEDIDMRIADLKNTKTQLEAIEFELKTLYQNAEDTMVGGFHITNTYNKQDYIQMNAGYYMGVFADQKNNYDLKKYYNNYLKKEVEKASKYNLSSYLDKGESREDIQMVDLERMLNECPSQKQLFYYNINKLLDFISKNAKSGKISTKSGATTYIYTREDSPLKVSNLSSIFEGTYKLPFNTTKEIDWHNAIGDAYGSMIAKVTFNSNNTFNIDFNYYLQDQYIWGSNYNRAGNNARAASEGGLSILCKVGYSAKKGVFQEIEGKNNLDYVEETVTPKEYKMLGIYNDSYKNLSLNYRFPAKDPQEKNRIYYYDDNAKLLKTLMLNKSEGLTLETSLTSKEGYKLVGWVDRVEGSELYPIESEEAIYPEKDMILTPKYERLNVVTFKDYDGTILNTQYVERGKSAVAPENPRSKREGYYFRAWDKDFNSIYRDTTITAEYALKKYKVKYYDKDGNMIGDTRIHKHGSDGTGDVKAPEYPGYTFKGWDKDITNITSDMNVKAIYEKNKYSVEFRGYKNGIKDSLIDKQTVEYGNSAIAPTVPNDPAYTFLKWDRDYSIITANTVVNGVYSINEYKVSFVDYDDKLLSMQTVKYGDSASAPKSPVREGYIFKGWDKSFNRVTSSIKVEPVYEKIKNKVVFKDNITGKVIFTQYVSYNENAKVPTIPEVEGYTFVNWQGDYSNVKEPKEIIANYKKKEYSVIFNDINGNIIKEQKVKYLDDAQAPEVPQEEGYDFNGWDNSFENVKGDLVVNAKYSKKKFKVVFKDVEGNVLSNQTVEYGDSAIEPQVELEKGMKFNGWDKSFDFITEDIEISALSEKIMFNVVFKNMCGDIISTQAIAYGEDAKEPEIPQEEGYTFVKWSSKFTKIKSNKEIKAIYKVNKYTVTFLDIDGDAMEIHHVTYGNKAPEPLPPEVEGKIFDGWDTDFSSVKTDLVVKPIYKNVEVKDNEEIKVPSGDNDKIEDNNKSDGEHGKTGDNNMANMVLIGVSMIFGLFGMKKFSRNNN